MADPKREDQIASCFGQGIDPKDAVADYGQLDGDHSPEEVVLSFWRAEQHEAEEKEIIIYPQVD